MTALMHTARNGYADSAEALLATGAKIQIQRGDGNGWTALWFAVRGSHKNVVRLLISHGAD
jgi:ankyrin repeat protein